MNCSPSQKPPIKLNNHNYKIYKIIVKLLHFIFIKIVDPVTILILIIFTLISIISRSFILIILLPLNLFIIYICSTSLCGMLPLIYSVLFYYVLRFNQINTQLRLFHKIKIISLQISFPIIFCWIFYVYIYPRLSFHQNIKFSSSKL